MAKTGKFGTFSGVFTPSILTILGVIMYLRLPYIIGEAGLLYTLGIIVVAHIISVTTGLSVSTIATDKKVKAGGTYYMISRSLGLPIGGTLGLALFVGLSFSVSLYLIGFSESLLAAANIEPDIDKIRITGTIALLCVTILTFISTSLAMKTQYFIMAAIVLSLISIFIGAKGHEFHVDSPLLLNPLSTVAPIVLFGIFFPAVTGFEAGVSMSGDLEDPKKSIPRGTILAIVVGLLVYIVLACFFAFTVDGEALRSDPNVLTKISRYGWLVTIGILGATLSSALGSILGAPRILQATATDKISPKFFSKGYGATNEPRNALLITFIIAEAGILIGELNVIARIVSIFFITTYGFLNLSCAFEGWTSADFRPSFKAPVWVSLIGAIACFLVMIKLDIVATIGASVILGLLFLFLKRRELTLQSGDAWSGVWASLVKSGLEKLSKEKLEVRNWRPNVIMFCGGENERPHLAELGMAIIGKLGILSSFELIQSDKPLLVKQSVDISPEQEEKKYFHHKYECRNVYEGMSEITRIYGFSGIEPNTVLMGWSLKTKRKEEFLQLIRGVHKNDFNSIFLSYDEEKKFGENKSIDIWWGGSGRNLSLAINLLRHLTSSPLWKEAMIRLLVINPDNTQEERVYRSIERIVGQFRVDLKIKIINNGIDQLTDREIIEQESDLTDLTIIGISEHEYDTIEKSYDKISFLADKLRTTMFINASSVFDEVDINLAKEFSAERQGRDILVLPEISYSKYPEISSDIQKIDQHERKQTEVFFKKVFRDYFVINKQINEELGVTVHSITETLDKINIPEEEGVKIRKSVDRIRSEFYFHSKKMFDEIIESRLSDQQEILESGINWYLDQLDKNISRFPKSLKIKYYRNDLKIKKTDSGSLKWIKIRRRAFHPFAKTMIPGHINYREVAQYFLHDNRFHFLNVLLEDLKSHSIKYINQTQALLLTIEDQIDKIEKKLIEDDLNEASFQSAVQIVRQKFDQLVNDLDKMEMTFYNRLQFELRKNIQHFNNELEKININLIVRKFRRGKRFYSTLREKNESFASNWYDDASLEINKNYLEIVLLSFRDRVNHEIETFNHKLIREIEIKMLKSLEDLKNRIKKYARSGEVKKDLIMQKFSSNTEYLVQDFDERGKKLLKLASELPERISVSYVKSDEADEEENSEVLEIPVSRITHHFLESQFLGPVSEVLKKSTETVKNLVFNTNDLISLVKFNLDNIDENIEDKRAYIDSVVKDATKQIEVEEQRVNELVDSLIESKNELMEELFDMLSPYKMPQNAKEFSYLIRDYKSKKVISRFGILSDKTRGFLRNYLVKLMYSRSQGILLAQKLAEENKSKSVNEKVLDVIDRISPDMVVLDKLPHYYQNLFSGRSSIGENFWVRRPVEELQFKKALDRYKNGIQGAIVILGERNSGKTSLCMRLAKKFFLNDKVYHVFPSNAGSVNEEDFVREMQKSTSLGGSINDVMNTLPNQSVVFIHDLELWWNRTKDGLAVIKMIEWMINEYSYKCLFVFNINPFAYELINKLYDIEKLFIGAIKCQPLESVELMELIISRHRSSGLHFKLGKRVEEQLSELKLARLFNTYFDFSEGNPGVALNAWLANVENVNANELQIKSPAIPSIKIFDEIPDDWKVVLIQFIIHKRVSFEKLQSLLDLDEQSIGDLLLSLSRSGLVKERSNSIYYANPYVEPFLIKSFKAKGWL